MNGPPFETIASDLSCLHCGYNLRGLTGTGRCPECGKPVLDTLRGTTLHGAAPAAISRLVRGLSFLLAASVLVAATAVCSREPSIAFLCLGAGGSRAWILTISITEGHRAGALMLGVISLGCHVTGTFLVISARKRLPGAARESALAMALILESILLLPLFAIGLIEFRPQQEIVWITLVILDVVQSICWLFCLHDLAQTAGFPRLRRAFRFARLFAAGRLFTFVGGNLAIVGIGSDIACGLLTAILMAILARRLGSIARDNRRRGVPDWGLPTSEPATTIR